MGTICAPGPSPLLAGNALGRAVRPKRPVGAGICNGFQILLEAGLLPGAMLRNDHLQFRCSWIHVRVESTHSPFTSAAGKGRCSNYR